MLLILDNILPPFALFTLKYERGFIVNFYYNIIAKEKVTEQNS